jgi:hypothetical protein
MLSTLFDASLLTPEPPFGGSFFSLLRHGTYRAWQAARIPLRTVAFATHWR